MTLVQLYNLLGQFDPRSRVGIRLWLLAGMLVLLLAAWVVLVRAFQGGLCEWENRAVGAGFAVAGGLFVVSRFFLYEWFLASPPGNPNWFSVPFGAAYVVLVGVLFYRDWFRLGVADESGS